MYGKFCRLWLWVSYSSCFKHLCSPTHTEISGMFTTGLALGERKSINMFWSTYWKPIIMKVLLVMRTWAVWGRGRKLGIALFIFYTGLAAPMFVNMGLFLKSLSCKSWTILCWSIECCSLLPSHWCFAWNFWLCRNWVQQSTLRFLGLAHGSGHRYASRVYLVVIQDTIDFVPQVFVR